MPGEVCVTVAICGPVEIEAVDAVLEMARAQRDLDGPGRIETKRQRYFRASARLRRAAAALLAEYERGGGAWLSATS